MNTRTNPVPPGITGLILAGGQALRMGGGHKGLRTLNDRPLIEWIIERLQPQVPALIISANDAAAYARYGLPVIADEFSGTGPLAGMHAGLKAAATEWLVCVPCDAPHFPADLVARLQSAAVQANADVAVAATDDAPQPVFCLIRRTALHMIGDYLKTGRRRADGWYGELNVARVHFEDAAAFANINTPDALAALEAGTGQAAAPASLSVAELQAAIAAAISPLQETETVPLREAAGRVLAADAVSPIDVPGHPNSAMDGWALHGDSLGQAPVRLKQVGIARAGHPHAGRVGAGECVRIMTGAVVPEGTDTVVMQEVVQAEGDLVTIPAGQRAGQNVRRAGEDIARGAVALARGMPLRAAHLGLAASLGLAGLEVMRRVRVAVFSTGDELRAAGEALVPGSIYDSNRQVLLGMLDRLGCEATDLGLVPDDPAQLEAALRNAASMADVIITSGGVSSGDADPVRLLLAGMGQVRFCKVDIRPGRPFAFGPLRAGGPQCMLFGLPGNPVAAVVSFLLFVRPALLQMAGCTHTALPLFAARAATDIRKKPGRAEYQRGVLSRDAQGLAVRLTGGQGSGMLSSLCQADCLVVLEQARGDVRAGEWVDVMPVEGLI